MDETQFLLLQSLQFRADEGSVGKVLVVQALCPRFDLIKVEERPDFTQLLSHHPVHAVVYMFLHHLIHAQAYKNNKIRSL